MKQRFSSLDVKVIAHELNSTLGGLRISNIYDLSSRIFLLKCAKPGTKAQLLVDSGFRCHLTAFSRTAASEPSAFVSRLRDYLKSKRITGVSQVGTDRIIEISVTEGRYRLFLEFFAAGNIILTDADLNVLVLLREVSEGDEDVDVKRGGKYVVEAKQNFHGVSPLSRERVQVALEKQAAKYKAALEAGGEKAKRHKNIGDLRKALSAEFAEYPPHLLDHAFRQVGMEAQIKVDRALNDDTTMEQLMTALEKADQIFHQFDSTKTAKGYIIAKIRNADKARTPTGVPAGEPDTASSKESLLYDDYHPFNPAQCAEDQSVRVLEFENFNKTIDEFYSSIESQTLESRLLEREENARKKLQSAKDAHEKRLTGLQSVQELHVRKAQTIEANSHRVEEASAAVNGLIGQGMDWVDIGKLIEGEQSRNNVVARMIKLPLKLHENTITLLLDEPSVADESEEDDLTDSDYDSEAEKRRQNVAPVKKNTDKRLAIDVDLGISPWANARQYYDQRKSAAQKEQKTVAASEKALKSMEKKTGAELQKGLRSEKAALRPTRQQLFFEKFLYFVSSDGYLVLGGKDAQQNDILYQRYLQKGDLWVHADLNGAACVVVKNNPTTPDDPIPPSTLSQAGALSVCSSDAWDSKAVIGAWWVKADEVSKTTPSGEYLTTGGFIIKGQKNFLPPSQLLLGFGVYWLISEESRVNHGKHRLRGDEGNTPGLNTKPAETVDDLGAQTEVLSIEDPESNTVQTTGSTVPDLEDAANAGEEEVKENNTAIDGQMRDEADTDDDDDDDDGDDEGSDGESNASDAEIPRSNPLQHHHSGHQISETPTRSDSEGGEEEVEGGAKNHIVKTRTIDVEEVVVTHSAKEDEDENQSSSHTDTDTRSASLQGPSAAHTDRPDTPTSTTSSSKAKQPQHKRGANTKAAKRRAAKYAQQDEDDRALAMELLGGNKAEQRKQAEAEAKAQREQKAQADKERRRQQQIRAAEAEKARQQRLAKADTERADTSRSVNDGASKNTNSNNDDSNNNNTNTTTDTHASSDQAALEAKEHRSIDLLVPQAEAADVVLAAVPVCAPWTALGRCKYKVKLQPGNLKRGKTVTGIVNTWTSLGTAGKGPKGVVDDKNQDKDKVWPRELELLKQWRVEEIVSLLPVKGCRVVQSGGLAGASGAGSVGGKGTAGKGRGGGGGGGGGGGAKKGGKKGR